MAENVTLAPVTSFTNDSSAVATVNANSQLIESAFADCLSLSGDTPNAMQAILDMNSFNIINLPSPATLNSPVRLQDVVSGSSLNIQVPTVGTSGSTVPLLNGINTWSGTQTFSTTAVFSVAPTIPGFQNLTNSVEGTGFKGMDGINWFLWNAPALLGSPGLDSAPTLRVDRQPTGTGGTTGNTVAAIQANTVVPIGDSYSEWAILATLVNKATTGSGTQCVGIAAFASKEGSSGEVSPTFGGNISATDNQGTVNPTLGTIGLEVDVGCGPTNNINGGTDINGQRVGLYIGCGGAPGTHISSGIRMKQTAGVLVDRGISLQQGGTGYVVGLDTAQANMATAAVFMAANQNLVFDGTWSNQTPAANRYLAYNGGGTLIYHTQVGNAFEIQDAGSITLNASAGIGTGSSPLTAFTYSLTTQGFYAGTGTPTFSAAKGSIYMQTDGSSSSTRMFINTNGTTGWTNVVTAA